MANLIHSLDATSLSLLVNNYFKSYDNEIKNIYGIHDYFNTTFNNMPFILFIVENLKLIYIFLYSDIKYLKELDKTMINHIINYIDESFDNKIKTKQKNRIRIPRYQCYLSWRFRLWY